MSLLATFHVTGPAGLARLSEATRMRGLLRRPSGNLAQVFGQVARPVGTYEGSGYDYAVLVAYLDEQDVVLAPSSYDDVLTKLAEALEATPILVMPQAAEPLGAVDPPEHDESRLRTYFEEFNEVEDAGAGARLLAALAELRRRAAALGEDEALILLVD